MPQSPDVKHIHGILSPVDFSDWQTDNPNRAPVADARRVAQENVLKHFKSRNFTPENYQDLMSGHYHDNFHASDMDKLHELLKGHRHNNPVNNDIVLDNLVGALKGAKDTFWGKHDLSNGLSNLHASPEKIQDIIDQYEDVGHDTVAHAAENPGFNREHLASILNKPSIPVSDAMVNHPMMDQELFDKMMAKKKYAYDKVPGSALSSKFLTSDHAKKMLEGTAGKDFGSNDVSVSNLLDKLTDDQKHKFIKDKLGINGGKPAQTKEDIEENKGWGTKHDPEDLGWDNWSHGDNRDNHMAELLASSKSLSPDEIDHIKRHGSFKEKFALFHNENIDPKHAIDMLSKWDNDDTDHGYDKDEMGTALAKEKEDEKWEDFNEEARETAEEENPMSDYLKNFSNDELSDAYFDTSYSSWKNDWIRQNKGATDVPNPNFDSSEPETGYGGHNPKNVKLKDLDDSELEEHPEYENGFDTEAEDAFKTAMDNEQTPDSIYEGYDEYVRDDQDRAMENLFDHEKDNWSSSEYMLPNHVSKAIKAPWEDEENITPQQLEAGLEHPLKMVRDTAASNPNMTPELISKVLNGNYDDEMKEHVLDNHKNIQPEHLTQAINSKNPDVAKRAVRNPKATPEHISQAIEKHPEKADVIRAALESPAANDEHAKKVIQNHKSDKWNASVDSALDPKFNLAPEDLQHAMEQGGHIGAKAIHHPNSTKEMIQAGLQHSDKSMREAAKHIEGRRFPPTADAINLKTGTHPLRQLRDFIDQHGGTISKSKMKSLGVNPAPIDKLFKPNGTVASADIQNYIDQTPGTQYNTSHSKWEGGQRHSDKPSDVFQLNYTQDQVNAMEKAGVLNTFQKIAEASFSSGHPVKSNTLGWVRYTGNPEEGFHVDEIQSDFGQSMIKRVAAQAKEALRTGAIDQDQAEDAMKRAKDYYPEDHVAKITEILFGKKHPSEVLHEGFKEYMRQKGFGNSPIHIWQPQSKAPLSGQSTSVSIQPDRVQDIVNGAKKGEVDNHAKALIGWGQKQKILPASYKDIKPEHLDLLPAAYIEHVNARTAQHAAGSLPMGEEAIPKLAVPLPVHMQEGYGAIPKKMKYTEGAYGELPSQENPQLKGQPTYKDTIRKSEVDAQTRNKIAITLKAIKDNGQVWEQLKETNGQAYQALMNLVQSLVDVFKKKSGEDPQALVHELEIQQQIEEQQQQAQGQQGQPQQEGQPSQPSQPNQDQPLHRKQMVYSPGSQREYSPQDMRIKDQEGNWNAFKGGLQDGSGGQGE